MSRRTPEQIMAAEMQKLKDMGITISTSSARSAAFEPQRPTSIIAKAAKEAGIYYEQENK